MKISSGFRKSSTSMTNLLAIGVTLDLMGALLVKSIYVRYLVATKPMGPLEN